jgi:hypothetical protein
VSGVRSSCDTVARKRLFGAIRRLRLLEQLGLPERERGVSRR